MLSINNPGNIRAYAGKFAGEIPPDLDLELYPSLGLLSINNPGNIRISSDQFIGEVFPSKNMSFKQFSSMALGYRAMFILIGNYYKNGINTVSAIINRYAPPSDNNDTGAYTNYVCMRLGVNPNDVLNLNDKNTFIALVTAMSNFENGVPAVSGDVSSGWDLAFPGQAVTETASKNKVATALIIGALIIFIIRK